MALFIETNMEIAFAVLGVLALWALIENIRKGRKRNRRLTDRDDEE